MAGQPEDTPKALENAPAISNQRSSSSKKFMRIFNISFALIFLALGVATLAGVNASSQGCSTNDGIVSFVTNANVLGSMFICGIFFQFFTGLLYFDGVGNKKTDRACRRAGFLVTSALYFSCFVVAFAFMILNTQAIVRFSIACQTSPLGQLYFYLLIIWWVFFGLSIVLVFVVAPIFMCERWLDAYPKAFGGGCELLWALVQICGH